MGAWLQELDPEKLQKLIEAGQGAAALEDQVDTGMGIVALLAFLIYIVLALFMLTSGMTIFHKAGKPWWAAIIPIYNIIVMLEIIGKPLWWIIMFFIPIANLVFAIMAAHALCRAFGKDVGFTIGLLLLPILFYPMLAFGTAQYQGAPT